ncbi:MAG: hypothetical protein ACE5FK_03265 [Candidatus Methylomirabilia bacterium]
MEAITLIIALVALVIGILAFVRAGGIQDLRRQGEGIGAKTETARDMTADALDRLERLIRGRERPQVEEEGGRGDSRASIREHQRSGAMLGPPPSASPSVQTSRRTRRRSTPRSRRA